LKYKRAVMKIKKRPISFITVSLLLFVSMGMIQYAPIIFKGLAHGNVVLWTIAQDTISNEGFIKYLKDIFVIAFGFYWPYWLSKQVGPQKLAFIIKCYFSCVALFLIIGSIGYFVGFSPLFFLKAGVRWVLLFHTAFGFFMVAAVAPCKGIDNKITLNFLVAVMLLNVSLLILQLKITGFSFGSAIGSSRLSGIFSNAAIAGYFSVSISLIVLVFTEISVRKKFLLLLLCLFVAICSGTRFAMISVFLCFCLPAYEYLAQLKRSWLAVVITLVVPSSIVLLVVMYNLMLDVAGRGGLVEAQLGTGGRIYHLFYYVGILFESDPLEFFVGRGLGIGTNTGHTMALLTGVSPDTYRFNWLVDNAIITLFFQVGFMGSSLFWIALFLFVKEVRRACSVELFKYWLLVTFVFLMSIFTINTFEIYYLIITYMFTYGVIYNKSTLGHC